MKNLMILVLLTACCTVAISQTAAVKPKLEMVTADQVPDSVKSAFIKSFAGTPVTKWETRAGKKGTHYIAEFTDATGLRSRVRYDQAGTLILTTRFFGPNQLPSVVVTAAQRYTGYKPVMAEEMISAKKQKTWYSLRLRSTSGKMQVLLDEQGNEVNPARAPEEVQPEAAPTTN